MSVNESFFSSDIFKSLSEDKKQLITDFLKSGKPSVNDMLQFINKINSGTPLTEDQRKSLACAISENLSQNDKKTISNIMKIIQAFS